jgi:hypothetical protein
VTNPGLCAKFARPEWIVFYLLAKLAHEHADVLRLNGRLRVPDLFDDLSVGRYNTRRSRKKGQ